MQPSFIIVAFFNAMHIQATSLQKQILRDTNGKVSQLPPPAKRFETELEKTGFAIFKPISDLGFYEWEPDIKGHSPFNQISVDEIKRQLDTESKPALLVDTRYIRLPFSFFNLPPQTYENKYPLSHYDVAGIHVATTVRGLLLEDVDFVFGGSTLSTLASNNEAKKVYLATKIPGTSVGLVVKNHNYMHDFAEPGFQFQRLVTGKPIDARTKPRIIYHMQLMQVGVYKILFIAEVDALKDGEPAEVACSNPVYWGINKCLQCVSSGSPILCHGSYRRGRITFITIKNLPTLCKEASVTLRGVESSILRALDDMKQQLDDSNHSGDYEISFSTEGKLSLVARSGPSKLLPSPDVVGELLAQTT